MTEEETLTPFQARVLRMYRLYRKRSARFKVANRNAHLTIRMELMDWLAQDLQRETFALEVTPVAEQAEMIDVIVEILQGKRTDKSNETRASNLTRAQKLAKEARQQSFDL